MLGVLAGLASLALLVPLQWVNTRVRPFGLPARALLDTGLHGLVPAACSVPFLFADPSGGWSVTLAAFLAGFLLDVDHVIAFRSLSFETCNAQERRPFGHGLLAVATGGALALALPWAPAHAAAVAFALASHIFFDATDSSGVPLFWPARPVVKRAPMAAYALFLLGGLFGARALAG
jgi:membrane-bound metal-dependent hydrolase YbcI (DUF457 family)